MIDPRQLQAVFGGIDVYVFDQLLRANIAPGMRVFDAGCGGGRNLRYLMRAGFEVMGLDRDPRMVEATRDLARRLAPRLPADAFRVESLESSTFPDACADVVLINAVLHFARDHHHFDAELDGAWRLLAPGGLFFARLASSIGIEDRVRPQANGRFVQPDGAELYLVDEQRLLAATARLGGQLVDPIKTTNVGGLRCMTTWVMRKSAGMSSTDRERDPIPEDFGTEEQAAAFWNTHSLASYQDFLEPVDVDVDIERRHFEIEVEEKVFLGLTEEAKKAHTSVKDLASRMLREKLATA